MHSSVPDAAAAVSAAILAIIDVVVLAGIWINRGKLVGALIAQFAE
jgi:hypothetical protein